MKFLKALVLSVVVLTAFSGCETTSPQSRNATPSEAAQIEVFRDGSKPTKPYKEIGQLADDGKEVEQPAIEAKLIKKAKRMGGQAIIFETPKQSGMEAGYFSFGVKYTFLYKATVVVYQ